MAVADTMVTQNTVADFLAIEAGATVRIYVEHYLGEDFVREAYDSGYITNVNYADILDTLTANDESFDFALITIQFSST